MVNFRGCHRISWQIHLIPSAVLQAAPQRHIPTEDSAIKTFLALYLSDPRYFIYAVKVLEGEMTEHQESGLVILDTSGVLISSTLAKFGATTFAINGISRIYIGRNTSMGYLWLAIGAAFFSLLLLASIWPFACFLAILAIIFLAAYLQRKHVLMLSISSGDQEAFSSARIDDLLQIKRALEKAITLRG